MSKKTWSTILVVVLILAAIVGIYFATQKKAPAAPETPVVEATAAPAAEAPKVEEAAKEAVAEAAEKVEEKTEEVKADAAAAVETATDKVAEKADEAKAAVAEVAEKAEEKAEEVKTDAAAAVETATEKVAEKADEAKAAVAEVAEKVEEKVEEVKADAAAAVETATDKVAEKVDEAKAAVAEVAEKVEEKAEEAKAAVAETAEKVEEAAKEAVGDAAAAVAAAVAPKGEKVQVALWHTFTEDQDKALQEIAKAYNDTHENVEVVVQSQPRQGFQDKVFNAVRTKSGPNMIISFSSDAAKFVDAKDDNNTLVVDMAKHMTEDELNAIKANLPAKIVEETVIYEDGKMHTLPVYTSGPILYYNETMLDELGVTVPTTWEELEKVSRAIKDKYGVPGFAADSITDTATILMLQNGAQYIDAANRKVVIDSDKAAARVQWFADLVKEGVFTLAPTGQYFSNDFNSKLIGMYLGSNAGLPYLTPEGFEMGVAPCIQDGETKWYPAWNRSAIAFKVSDEADKATVDFIRFFTNDENSAKFAVAVVAISPYKSVASVDVYKAMLEDGSLRAQSLKAVEANLDYAAVLPIVKVSSVVRTELERAVTRVATEEDVKAIDALKEAAEVANKEWEAE